MRRAAARAQSRSACPSDWASPPPNGLDPEGVRWIRSLLRKLAAEGRTVLASSHLISEIALVADHLLVLSGGRLLADTTVTDLSAGSASLEDAFLTLTSGGEA
jgi:ABC-2 type transport system ATP-binding protein